MKKSGNKVRSSFVVKNIRGLHTRPATELIKCVAPFKSHITLTYQKQTANAKSLLGILMLEAAKGAKISVEAVGDDAEQAVAAILSLANAEFNIKY